MFSEYAICLYHVAYAKWYTGGFDPIQYSTNREWRVLLLYCIGLELTALETDV